MATYVHFYCTRHKTVLLQTQPQIFIFFSAKFHPKGTPFEEFFSGCFSSDRPPPVTDSSLQNITQPRILAITTAFSFFHFFSLRRMQQSAPTILGSLVDRWISPLVLEHKKQRETVWLVQAASAFSWLQPKHLSLYWTQSRKVAFYIPPVLAHYLSDWCIRHWITALLIKAVSKLWGNKFTLFSTQLCQRCISWHNYCRQKHSNKFTVFRDEHRAIR